MRTWSTGFLAMSCAILGSGCGRVERGTQPSTVQEFDYKSHLVIVASNKAANTFDVRVVNLAGQTIREGHFASPQPDQLKGTLGSSGPLEFPIPAGKETAEAVADYVHGLTVLWSKEGRDHAGCDIIDEIIDTSCSSKGNCCDTHDKCYADNNCGVASCTGDPDPQIAARCCSCDTQVIGCVIFGSGSTGQQSECCWWGICGQEGGWYDWGDHGQPWCDWQCSPHCYCI